MVNNGKTKLFGSRRKNSKFCSEGWHRCRFWSAFRHFGTHFAEIFCMSKSSWMLDPTRSCEMSSCSAIDLAEIRPSSKISSWIRSIICAVVSVLGRPGRGASQVEKSPVVSLTRGLWPCPPSPLATKALRADSRTVLCCPEDGRLTCVGWVVVVKKSDSPRQSPYTNGFNNHYEVQWSTAVVETIWRCKRRKCGQQFGLSEYKMYRKCNDLITYKISGILP